MSADRTALTLDGQSRIQMLANGNENKLLVPSSARRRGPASHGHRKIRSESELTFECGWKYCDSYPEGH